MRLFIVTTLAATAAGCAEVSGRLTIEGETVGLESCESIVPRGFDGVDLLLAGDRVIRLFRQGTNITEVGFFESQVTEEGFLVGACATGSIRDTNVKTGEVVQLEGEATFSCETPLAIGGSATFSGCAK